MGHWLWLHGGLSNGNSPWYLWPSGWGSILIPPILTAVPIVITLLRKNNCHVHRCWRLGRHPVEGTAYLVCHNHDPAGKITATDVRERYHLYMGRKPGPG